MDNIPIDVVRLADSSDEPYNKYKKTNEDRLNANFRRLKEVSEQNESDVAKHEAELQNLLKIGATFAPTPSGVTLANSTMTTVVSQALTVGLWIVSYRVRFPANATGLRKALASLSQNSSTSIGLMCDDERQAVSGDWTYCAATFLRRTTANETIYINASQNSGASMSSVIGRLQAVRIG